MNPETIPQRVRYIVEGYGTAPAQMYRSSTAKEPTFLASTYKDLWDETNRFAAGLSSLGTMRSWPT